MPAHRPSAFAQSVTERAPDRSAACLVLALTCALAGCDPQAPDDYDGEPLLMLTGRAELAPDAAHETERAALQPVVGFLSRERGGALHITDVVVQGEFPNRFTLDLYAPPPPDALVESAGLANQRLALGVVAAAPADHASLVPLTVEASSGASECDEQGCERFERSCIAGDRGPECFVETRRCPDLDVDYDTCEVIATTGDPRLRDEPWSSLAGVADNYVILYLDAPLAETWSYRLGASQALDAGYHLLATRDATEDESAAAQACADTADKLAVQRYNDLLGTSLGVDAVDESPCDDEGDVCLDSLVAEATAELRCPMIDVVWERVEDPQTPISLRIGRNLQGPLRL